MDSVVVKHRRHPSLLIIGILVLATALFNVILDTPYRFAEKNLIFALIAIAALLIMLYFLTRFAAITVYSGRNEITVKIRNIAEAKQFVYELENAKKEFIKSISTMPDDRTESVRSTRQKSGVSIPGPEEDPVKGDTRSN